MNFGRRQETLVELAEGNGTFMAMIVERVFKEDSEEDRRISNMYYLALLFFF
jgi:hypothetical protein